MIPHPNPEYFVEAGQALIQLGRTYQRTYPNPSVLGCQFDEQAVLDQLLPQSNGIYVDIGANDGIDCSNSIAFYNRGWRGLLIEPLPDILPILLLNRPGDIICPVAASDIEGVATLHRCRSVSSLNPDWRTDNESTIPILTRPLRDILKRYPWIDWAKTDFLSIDCEGHEGAVLRGIDWANFRPKVVMIEYADQHGNDISADWLPLLLEQGYKEVHRNGLNMILTL